MYTAPEPTLMSLSVIYTSHASIKRKIKTHKNPRNWIQIETHISRNTIFIMLLKKAQIGTTPQSPRQDGWFQCCQAEVDIFSFY